MRPFLPPAVSSLLPALQALALTCVAGYCSWRVAFVLWYGRLVDKKNARRYDDCLLYSMVSAKKVGCYRMDSADARCVCFAGRCLQKVSAQPAF